MKTITSTLRKLYDRTLLDIESILVDSDKYFINFSAFLEDYAGWKFTITGKSVDDAIYLSNILGSFLLNIGVAFKIGTKRLVDCGDGEQQYKLMTIYIDKEVDATLLEEDIKALLKDYKGGDGVELKYSEKINQYLYKRKDIDSEGNYIPAKPW